MHLTRSVHKYYMQTTCILHDGRCCNPFHRYCTLPILTNYTICLIRLGQIYILSYYSLVGGAMASWLVRSSPDWAVRVQALARKIVLCSWARHLTLTVPLFTQVYKWVPAYLKLGVTLRWTGIPSRGGVEILLVTSCWGNRDKLWPDGLLGS